MMAIDFIDEEAEEPPPQPIGLPLEIIDARPPEFSDESLARCGSAQNTQTRRAMSPLGANGCCGQEPIGSSTTP
jgi:hypothetical protein